MDIKDGIGAIRMSGFCKYGWPGNMTGLGNAE